MYELHYAINIAHNKDYKKLYIRKLQLCITA